MSCSCVCAIKLSKWCNVFVSIMLLVDEKYRRTKKPAGSVRRVEEGHKNRSPSSSSSKGRTKTAANCIECKKADYFRTAKKRPDKIVYWTRNFIQIRTGWGNRSSAISMHWRHRKAEPHTHTHTLTYRLGFRRRCCCWFLCVTDVFIIARREPNCLWVFISAYIWGWYTNDNAKMPPCICLYMPI